MSVPGAWRLRAVASTLMRVLARAVPDHVALAHRFQQVHGRPIDWHRPTLFNEKLYWLMRHARRPIMAQLADKYAVRAFIEERVGKHYLNDLYGVWPRAAAVPFSALPPTFVLKATHGSDMVLICRDRATFDETAARRTMTHWLRTDYGRQHREWVYRGLPRRVIAEALLDDGAGDLPDYKFLCFDGEPRLIQYDVGRFTDHRRELFTPDWQRVTAYRRYPRRFPPVGREVPRPSNLADMLECAARLSQGFTFVRVDLYAVGGRTVFGEMTWFPGAGYETFEPVSAELLWGQAVRLPREGGRPHD